MKKVLIILILLLSLCGCQKSEKRQLKDLGYTDEDIELIETLSEDTRASMLEQYQGLYLHYLRIPGAEEEHLADYARYYGNFSDEMVIRLVNEGIINDSNAAKLKELYDSDYYLARNEQLYLQYLNDYPTVRDVVEIVNTKRYLELYSDIQTTDLSKDYLLLVNKYYQLPADYEPDDLVYIADAYGYGQLREAVYDSYIPLFEDACAEGYYLQIVSAYRSYYTQEVLYERYLGIDPQEVVDTYSARPGHSEHQSGLCMDVTVPGYSLDDFFKTDASRWLAENCWKYGFIIRYPEDKTGITGYQGEAWQLRYLGQEVAKDVYDRGITYDEYYACFIE